MRPGHQGTAEGTNARRDDLLNGCGPHAAAGSRVVPTGTAPPDSLVDAPRVTLAGDRGRTAQELGGELIRPRALRAMFDLRLGEIGAHHGSHAYLIRMETHGSTKVI